MNRKDYYKSCLVVLLLSSCGAEKPEHQVLPAPGETGTTALLRPAVARPGSVGDTGIRTSGFTFEAYNDDGDYMQLFCKKGGDSYSFINERNTDRSLLRGDSIAVSWKNDTIYIAGDGERPELAKWVVTVKKIKDGKVSLFRKKYGKQLVYWPAQDYGDAYKQKMYLQVEYYLAHTKNELLRYVIEQREDIEFSMEEQVRERRTYEVLGIATVEEHRHNTIQWLYYDRDTGDLYEYDLPNDRLVLFAPAG